MERTGRLDRGDGVELAWAALPGNGPTLVFLPGFSSDMTGSKAIDLLAFCEEHGHAMVRLDYSGHGASGGAFTDGTIGRWTEDALAVIDAMTEGPLLLVGSSMGGWIGLLIALARPERVIGLVGIAAAPDFTERLMWQAMPTAEQETLRRDGRLAVPSQYGEPLVITLALIEDGRRHMLLDAPIPLTIPVRLLQGQRDDDVPWETALTLARQIAGDDVQVTLVKDGDHRLARPADLALLRRAVGALLRENGA
ncbi:MAG TPA: alpha/beta hydrolase [Acetobacteraceae bacterium]